MKKRSAFRRVVRAALPARARRALRIFATELPHRLADAAPDLVDRLSKTTPPLPPARLRRRVGINGSREHFLRIGKAAAPDILGAVRLAAGTLDSLERWLDFGCGCGRVARHLQSSEREIHGVDIDLDAIEWCRSNLGQNLYATIAAVPPMPFEPGSFDVIYSVSVFTHLDEKSQFEWLAELHRVLRSGGLLVVSTHGPELVYNRPDLGPEQHVSLRDRGFTFASSEGPFNDDSAFHSRAYLEREWGTSFELLSHKANGLIGYQDLSVWRKR